MLALMLKDNEVLTVGMNELPSSLDPPTDWAIACNMDPHEFI